MESIENLENDEEQLLPGCVLIESVAIADVKAFVDEITDDFIAEYDINQKYRRIVRAVMLGKIVLTSDPLIYILREPIKNPEGMVTISQLELKTRITAEDQIALAKGLDIKKDKLLYFKKCIGHVIGQPVGMISKFGRNDYKFIEEITQLFL